MLIALIMVIFTISVLSYYRYFSQRRKENTIESSSFIFKKKGSDFLFQSMGKDEKETNLENSVDKWCQELKKIIHLPPGDFAGIALLKQADASLGKLLGKNGSMQSFFWSDQIDDPNIVQGPCFFSHVKSCPAITAQKKPVISCRDGGCKNRYGEDFFFLCIPVNWSDNQQGLLRLESREKLELTNIELSFLTLWGEILAALLQQNKELSNVWKQAVSDPLTGIYNRRYFDSRLRDIHSQAVSIKTPYSVLFIDIDNFKKINDTLGHAEGDKLLTEVAVAIQGNIREGDILSRIGGEEFAVILPCTSLYNSFLVAEKLCAYIERHFIKKGGAQITVSIGVSSLNDYEVSPEDVLSDADRAMFAAKRKGRNCVVKLL